jgi:hypothetical protein
VSSSCLKTTIREKTPKHKPDQGKRKKIRVWLVLTSGYTIENNFLPTHFSAFNQEKWKRKSFVTAGETWLVK